MAKKGIIIVLLTAVLLLASISCSSAPRSEEPVPTPAPTQTRPSNLRYLNDEEKAKVIEIALNTPEAKAALETYSTYKEGELGWAAIVYEASGAVSMWELNYNVVEKGIPSNVPPSANIYPRVRLHFGEPEPDYPEGKFLVDVTVDLVNEKTVGLVVTHPLKKLPSK